MRTLLFVAVAFALAAAAVSPGANSAQTRKLAAVGSAAQISVPVPVAERSSIV